MADIIDPAYIKAGTVEGDLISRQAAIKSITGYNGVMDKSVAKRLLIQSPSAQPEIIHCRECKRHIDGFFCQAANHHTSDKDCCAIVFGAERREE